MKDRGGGLVELAPELLLAACSSGVACFASSAKASEEALLCVQRSLISWHYDLSAQKRGPEGRQSRFARPLRLITLCPAIRLHLRPGLASAAYLVRVRANFPTKDAAHVSTNGRQFGYVDFDVNLFDGSSIASES